MKLGQYAKEREKRVLKHLYKNSCQTRDEMQSALYHIQNTIDVAHPLSDLIKMKLVKTNASSHNKTVHYQLTKKGQKLAKKLIKKEKGTC